jgi:radical SAM protein with 4Fe4S-binding SPASM domain
MIAYSRKAGIPSGISTNATTLNEETSRRLIDSGLDYIIFAFDGATRETYEAYRRGASFDQVRDNILGFLTVKKAMRSNIFCIIQMVALKENRREIPALLRMWDREGIDDIRIKKDEVHNAGSAIPEESRRLPPMRNPCFHLWRGPMYIHYDGTTYPCCYAYPDEPIGNVADRSLQDLWNSEKIIRMRKAHLKGDLQEFAVCRRCFAARPRLPLILGSFLINTHAVRKTIPFFERIAQLRRVSVFETLR